MIPKVFCRILRHLAGKRAKAAALLEQARRLDPAHRWTTFLPGLCTVRQGRYEEAIAAFSLCIGADPTNAVHYDNRALALAAVGQEDRAIADLDQTLRLASGCAPTWLERGTLHVQQRRLEEVAITLGCPAGRWSAGEGALSANAARPGPVRSARGQEAWRGGLVP
jgi:tetratricopeptide (TPR) repeat protein